MPILSAIPFTGSLELDTPLDKKTKEIVTLICQTPEQLEKDKKFLKTAKTPHIAGENLEVLNACLSAVTVLSFIAGPEGIVLGAGIVLFQGLINAAAHAGQDDPLTAMKKAVQMIHDQERTKNQLGIVRSVAASVENQWKQFVDDQRASAYKEKMDIDHELLFQTGAQPGSLGASVVNMEDLLTWDDTDVRVSILASITYLFIVFNLQCRIYASLAHIEAEKKDSMDWEKYESHVTTFRIRVRQMKNELQSRTTKLTGLYENLKTSRIAQATFVGIEKLSPPAFVDNNTVTVYAKYKDSYTDKEYSTVVSPAWYSNYPSDEAIDLEKAKKQAEFTVYQAELTDHATRAIANDLAVINQWAKIVGEAEVLLRPRAPIAPPKLDSHHATEKSKVHKYLADARWVSYAYSLGTHEDGDSDISPWTDWLKLEEESDKIQLPVLVLGDSNQIVETQRTIYHRKSSEMTPSTTRPPKEKVIDEWKAEIITAKGAIKWVEP